MIFDFVFRRNKTRPVSHLRKHVLDIDRTGSMAYSIHPLCAVSDRETSWQALGDVLFTIEGDE